MAVAHRLGIPNIFSAKKTMGIMAAFFGIRRCTACGLLKPVEQFPVRKGRPSPHPECLVCHNARWHAKAERNNAVARARYRRDPGKVNAAAKAWRQTHREWRRDYARKRYAADPAPRIALVKRYYSTEHGRKNRRLNGHRRRARESSAFVEDVDLVHLLMLQGYICHVCEHPILPGDESLDHVVPLARGGLHAWGNCLAAHARCNSRKMTSLSHRWRHPATVGCLAPG
jgi:5-methylcytosine-specific restriction endonuclease McrA